MGHPSSFMTVPMKTPLHAILVLLASLFIAPGFRAFAEDYDKEYDAACAEATKIIKQELIKNYEGEKGLLIKPSSINLDENPKLAALDEKFPTLWKQMRGDIADTYTKALKPINDKVNANSAKLRPFLVDAFGKAVELRGGGSASMILNVFSIAHVEWMIANVGRKKYERMSDEAFVSKLAKALSLEEGEHETEIRNALPVVLKAIKQAEAFLSREQIGFIRAEFLAYFQ